MYEPSLAAGGWAALQNRDPMTSNVNPTVDLVLERAAATAGHATLSRDAHGRWRSERWARVRCHAGRAMGWPAPRHEACGLGCCPGATAEVCGLDCCPDAHARVQEHGPGGALVRSGAVCLQTGHHTALLALGQSLGRIIRSRKIPQEPPVCGQCRLPGPATSTHWHGRVSMPCCMWVRVDSFQPQLKNPPKVRRCPHCSCWAPESQACRLTIATPGAQAHPRPRA